MALYYRGDGGATRPYERVIINAQATIDNVTGKLSDACRIGAAGAHRFAIALNVIATGAVDALSYQIRALRRGVYNSVASGTIANVTVATEVDIVTYVNADFIWPEFKLFVASAGATNTWTVTAAVIVCSLSEDRSSQFKSS